MHPHDVITPSLPQPSGGCLLDCQCQLYIPLSNESSELTVSLLHWRARPTDLHFYERRAEDRAPRPRTAQLTQHPSLISPVRTNLTQFLNAPYKMKEAATTAPSRLIRRVYVS